MGSTRVGSNHFCVVGVPTSVGSHNAGQERAPRAWRRVGLPERLAEAGLTVSDVGDLPVRRQRAAPRIDGVRALGQVHTVCSEVADAVADIASDGRVPLVLGGDCTITLGVVAGLRRTGPVGLLYFDGDADLNTPELSGSGVLDTMGITHLLGGGAASLADLGGDGRPLVADEHLALFGFDPAELDEQQWSTLVSRDLFAVPAPAVRTQPREQAVRAWERLAARVDRIVLHLDVDVLDTGAFPLANYPHFNGLSLDEARQCIGVWGGRPELAGVVITEVNPTHDPDDALLRQLLDLLVESLG